MSDELKLDTLVERVAYLFDEIPETRDNHQLLVLSYWRVFDGIDIPEWLVTQLVDGATRAESIARIGRKIAVAQDRIELLRQNFDSTQ